MWLKSSIVVFKLLWLMCAYAGSVTRRDHALAQLPASQVQLDLLAENVCWGLPIHLRNVTPRCIEYFNEPDKKLPLPRTGFRLRCHSNTSIAFDVKPSKHRYVVVAVPEPPNYDAVLGYRIIEPGNKSDQIDSFPEAQTIYTSILNDRGRHSLWRVDARIGKWEPPPQREYDIVVRFDNNTADNDTVDGVIAWNKTDDTDACFYFMSWCEKSGRVTTDITADAEPLVVFRNLQKNDSCKAQVIGKYGLTKIKFPTPISTLQRRDVNLTSPEIISSQALSLEQTGWTLRVNWSRPLVTPDAYNVTIFASDTVSLPVPGNETEVTFKNITGSGSLYYVAVSSILGDKAAHTSRRAFFPSYRRESRSQPRWRWGRVAGGAWGAAAAVAAAALAALRYIRRRAPPAKLIPTLMEVKPLEEALSESASESGSTDAWEVKSERVVLHEVVGEGAFGVVRRGTLAPTGREVAVKMLKEFPSAEEMRSFQQEMEVMKSVGAHPHVVGLVGCCAGRRPLIIAEYCSQGDLLSFLRRSWDIIISKRNAKYYNNNIETSNYRNDLFKCKTQEHSKLVVNRLYDLQGNGELELTALDLLSFCRQIAMGMEFLAANRLVHRDLAARNVLVTGDKMLKIADFGLSRDVYEVNHYKQKGNGKMPVKWMALESLTRRIYTTQSDVWSFGVVVWEIVTVGASPYPEVPAARLPRLLRAGYRMPRPANCSKLLYELMLSCWRARPRDRPTFPELHARLDELLNSACAHDYLSLELDDAPTTIQHKYLDIFIRAKRYWSRGESYERPLRACSNHYTTPPTSDV